MKKIGAAAAIAAMSIVVAALCGVALADDGHHASKPATGNHKKAKPQPQPKHSQPEAKVFICHATGSASNPFVLIHVSSHALKAHTSHQNGRDIVLGASPGPCPGATASVQSAQATSSCPNDDDDQAKAPKAHDDNGRGDDKNGQDRDQKAKAFKSHEDNDDDDVCPAAVSVASASQSNLSAVSVSSSNTSSQSSNTSSSTASSSNTAATSSNAASTPQSAGVLGTT